jgi:hypothetical protein
MTHVHHHFDDFFLSWQLAISKRFSLQKFHIKKKSMTGFPGQGCHFGPRISRSRSQEIQSNNNERVNIRKKSGHGTYNSQNKTKQRLDSSKIVFVHPLPGFQNDHKFIKHDCHAQQNIYRPL